MFRFRIAPYDAFVVLALLAWPAPARLPAADGAVEFNRDIRPLLSDNCFQCHGPDQAKRKADLRLDIESAALGQNDGAQRPIVPGDPAASELYRRIASTDADEQMPPPDSGRKLSAEQIERVRRWIEQGAKWQGHWSFIPPRRPALPAVARGEGVRNPIDAFVLSRLEREGLAPAGEAERTTLIRRVALDLTGLPPTFAEVDLFLADTSADAYERLVDRLLDSPRFGERMATRWLDGARYADTNGYQSDGERFMWRWRDWVIDAYNRNLPFDQFTIEQLAGDLLPGCTLDQRIATGFNRNHRGNAEGGIVPEEYAVEYVVDRVDTTATVWLGLTMGCCRCHDHKFDPLSQRDFYQLFAFFNNVPERGKAVKFGNSPPMVKAPTPHQRDELAQLEAQLAAACARFAELSPQLAAAQAEWEKAFAAAQPLDWTITTGLEVQYPLDGDPANQAPTGSPGSVPPKPVATRGELIAAPAKKLGPAEEDPHPALARFEGSEGTFAPGKLGQASTFDGSQYIDAGDVGSFGYYDRFSIAAWVQPQSDRGGTIVSRMTDAEQADGYYVALAGGKVQVNLVKRWLDDALRVETERSLLPGEWHHLMVTYDGSRVAKGVKVYIDGTLEPLAVRLDELNQSFAAAQPLRIGGGGGPEGRFHGLLDDVRIYDRTLAPEEVQVVATAETIDQLVSIPAERRTSAQAQKLRAYFLAEPAPEPIRQSWRQVVALGDRRSMLVESFPTTMVMEELPTPRDTFILVRGEYDKHGERVAPAVPASLPSLAAGATGNRLDLARWLVDPANPLTARVAVNRYWQMLFGTGLVKTVDDFGAQGEAPSHPELLDWLATEYAANGWNTKAIIRSIVTSAAYRQSSKVTPAMAQRDPENRLLARGPRFRLSAEMIRDQALAAAGLLVERQGGPSVMPYQPDGLWNEIAGVDYAQDHGESLYRRSMYTFWKRTVAPPTMITFDAAGRETCAVRETRTNTPLQALTLLNEVTFVECSRRLAERAIVEGGTSPEERITRAFRLALARPPAAAELGILVSGFQDHLAHYRAEPEAALTLVRIGESPRDERIDVAELAAYTAVAAVVLNLDETVTKE
jgi:mono/diheme cytochrome c family protein